MEFSVPRSRRNQRKRNDDDLPQSSVFSPISYRIQLIRGSFDGEDCLAKEKIAMPPSCPRPASAVSFADDEEEAISGEDERGVNGAEKEERPNYENAVFLFRKETTIEQQIRCRTIERQHHEEISRLHLKLRSDLELRDPCRRMSSEPDFYCRYEGAIKNS